MFKQRKATTKALEDMIEREAKMIAYTMGDKDISTEERKEVLDLLIEESRALISAKVAYKMEPYYFAAQICTVVLSAIWIALSV